jgi:hypothetical protein
MGNAQATHKNSCSTSAQSLSKSNTFYRNLNEYCVYDDEYVPPSSLKSGKKGILSERSIMTSASKNKVFNSTIEDLVDIKIKNVTVLAAKKK